MRGSFELTTLLPVMCLMTLCVVVSFTFVAPLAAQDARSEFKAGAKAYQSNDYPTALEHFEKSYSLREVPVVMFNIAQTLRKLGRITEAITSYEQYLADEIPEDRREEVLNTIDKLKAQLSLLQLTCNVPGATVTIDGVSVGITPIVDLISVSAGSRVLKIEADGYLTELRDMRFVRGKKVRLSVVLKKEPVYGTLTVTTETEDARIEVDDEGMGSIPASLKLLAGERKLVISASGFKDFEKSIFIPEKENVDLNVVMEERYKIATKWWFWAAIGAVAVVAIIVVLRFTVFVPPEPFKGSLGVVQAWVPQ